MSASAGQTLTHVGSPSQRSHFSTSPVHGSEKVAPNGQAKTQLRQPMQRVRSTSMAPVAKLRRVACFGHTSSQAGFSQRRQLIGTKTASRSHLTTWILARAGLHVASCLRAQ